MRISSFRLKNYKSFVDSEEIEFSEGFNVIVGPNNAGKTTLLEALSLSFVGKPHKSILTLPKTTLPLADRCSAAEVELTVKGGELRDFLVKLGRFWIPMPVDKIPPDKQSVQSFGLETLNSILNRPEVTFSLGLRAQQSNAPDWIIIKSPTFGLYQAHQPSGDRIQSFLGITNQDTKDFTIEEQSAQKPKTEFGFQISGYLKERIYSFRAERLIPGIGQLGPNTVLSQNAGNLPEVMDNLLGNPHMLSEYNNLVHKIFPSIFQVTVRHRGNSQGDILIWQEDSAPKRDDLAIELSESGTGVGQVLAMLYVVMMSKFPQTIIIDEPNSFLHPGAARKLLEILKSADFSHHQYIVSTHSPEILRASDPRTVTLIRWEKPQSRIEQLNPKQVSDVQRCLVEVGAKLSDLYGADNILWVEGDTETNCFPIILAGKHPLVGTSIVSVRNPGDFEAKRRKAEEIWEIYEKLSNGNALIPPAIAFVFDRDKKTEWDMEDLKRRSKGRVHFLPRRTYENFLLSPRAISAVIADLTTLSGPPPTEEAVTYWFQQNGSNKKYIESPPDSVNISDPSWLEKVHGANLLYDLFQDLCKHEYRKTLHSTLLTEWLIVNDPVALKDLTEFLLNILQAESLDSNPVKG